MSPAVDETHDPGARTWVETGDGHPDFPLQNLPYGVFSSEGEAPRAGVAIGERILDLAALAEAGAVPAVYPRDLFGAGNLNALLALPPDRRAALRRELFRLLSDEGERARVEPCLRVAEDCRLHLPAAIGDYTDFYAGLHHAVNVGRLFRPDNPLLPNYKYVPIGYHGRSSSVRLSGEPVIRPNGQSRGPGAETPGFGPSRRLDYELELGVWIGPGNVLGAPIPIGEAGEHVAGFCLLNDWSARDLQAWEYQPLGPFLAKNFHTTISPWIVTAEAMAPFRAAQPARPAGDPQPLPYLWDAEDQAGGALSIELEVLLSTAAMREAGSPPCRLARGPASNLYWTVAQLVAHHSSGGCNLNPGDLLGTGTISTAGAEGRGSLLEISEGGARSLVLPNGETRTFVEDGDVIAFTGRAHAEGRVSIGFGPCWAEVVPRR